jgi:DNA-binding transcriptional ArsR family regulator
MDMSAEERRQWSLLSSHGQVLAYIGREPEATVRRLSDALHFSERRIMGVLRDLEDAGMIRRHRRGRQNAYEVNSSADIRAPALPRANVGDLLRVLSRPPTERGGRRSARLSH